MQPSNSGEHVSKNLKATILTKNHDQQHTILNNHKSCLMFDNVRRKEKENKRTRQIKLKGTKKGRTDSSLIGTDK